MAQERKARFQREKTGSFALTERDVEIIRHVARHRFLRSTHIVKLFPDSSSQKLLRRLQLLFHAGYLDRPLAQIDYYRRGSRPMVYGLGNKGIELLAGRFGITPSKVDWTSKNRTASRGFLEHTLEIADFMVALELACRKVRNIRLIPPEEILVAAPPATRTRRNPFYWQTEVTFDGQHVPIGVVPDKMFGLQYLDKPASGNRAFFFLEADRGTMPATRRNLRQTSFLRKLLSYGHTYRDELHVKHFGIKNFRVLTVTTSPDRIESFREAHRAFTASLCPAGAFLFADRAALSAHDPLTLPWVNGRGETVLLNS